MNAEGSATVYVVDDDASLRRGLSRLLRAAGHDAKTFSSAREFLDHPGVVGGPSCLVLDVCIPGMGGIELQKALHSLDSRTIPIIFITGHGDIPTSVRAMKGGAVDFLAKPFDEGELLRAVDTALERDREVRHKRATRSRVEDLVRTLTRREREVLCLVVAGQPNKRIAGQMGIGEKTVKVHRGRVMHKMQAGSLAELVRLAQEAGVEEFSQGGVPIPPKIEIFEPSDQKYPRVS